MSNLQEKINKEYPLYDIPNSISKTDEYNGNEIQLIKISAFQNGYEICQKEYEEKLRFIPVEEKLPEKQGHYLVIAPKSFPKNCKVVVAEFYEDNNTFYSESSDCPIEDATHWRSIL